MSRDELEFDDDDDLRLYVAAFREVEQPTPATHAANWHAIAERTGVAAGPRRWWLWVGAAATLAAAAWILASFAGVALQRNAAVEPDVRDQAGYVHGDESGGEAIAKTRRPAAPAVREVEAELEAPVIDEAIAAPVVEPTPEPAASPKPVRGKSRATSLADETALFGEIQRALVENQPAKALAAIAQHEREFPRGAFRNERIVAKARALCAAGKRDAAKRVRDQFLAQHAASHLAPSMRSVCAD